MKQLVLVFIGGGTGSVFRFLISRYVNSTTYSIPYGTFLVNVLGCFLIGIILGVSLKNTMLSQHMTLVLATGFCGGFTTFSSFAYENQVLLRSGDIMHFGVYTIGSIVIGFLLLFLGMWITK